MIKRMMGQRGFTLLEMLVGISILGLISSGLGSTIFYSFRAGRDVVSDGQAINELRRGLGYFSSDVTMAKTSNLTDGGAAASSVTFTWTDEYGGAGTPHTLVYSLSSGSLMRALDGSAYPVARNVTSISFTRSGRAITAQAQVDAGYGSNRTLSMTGVMRVSS